MLARHEHHYKTPAGNEFHHLLVDFINDEKNIREIEDKISTLSNRSSGYNFMFEVDQENRSHLINVLHLCLKKLANDKEKIKQKAKAIWRLLTNHLKSKGMSDLYYLRGNNRVSSLHLILQVADVELVEEYFNQLKPTDDLQILLCRADSLGFTPLHRALASKELRIVEIYFAQLNNAVKTNKMIKSEYEKVLCDATNENYSSLFSALISKKLKILDFYLSQLMTAYANKWISKEGFKSILIMRNSAGFSSMHELFVSHLEDVLEQTERVNLYFEFLQTAYMKSILSKTDVKELFCNPNNAGFTTLHEVLYTKMNINLKIYLSNLRWAYGEKILFAEDLKELFGAVNVDGYSALHQVLLSESPDMVTELCDEIILIFLSKVLTSVEVWILFCKPNEKDVTTMAMAFLSKNIAIINTYLIKLYYAIDKQIITLEDLKNLLCCPNKLNYTPFVQALNSEKTEVFKAYWEQVDKLKKCQVLLPGDEKHLLTTTTLDEIFSPLHVVLRCSKEANIAEKDEIGKIYFELISRAYTNKTLSKDDINFLFTHTTKAGFSTLHFALMKIGFATTKLYFGYLVAAVNSEMMSFSALKNLISLANKGGFTPLHQALVTANLDRITLYFDLLIFALTKKVITLDDAEAIFCQKLNTRNILHIICKANVIQVAEKTITFMENLFGIRRAHTILNKLVNEKTHDGYYPQAFGGNRNRLNAILQKFKKIDVTRLSDSTTPLYYSGLLIEIPFVEPPMEIIVPPAEIKKAEEKIVLMNDNTIYYENPIARDFFALILAYCKSNGNENDLKKVDEFLKHVPRNRYLYERNSLGNTFLMVCLSFPFAENKERILGIQKSLALLNTLVANLNIDEIADLWKLRTTTQYRLTSMRNALKTTQFEVIQTYFTQLNYTYSIGKIHQADMVALFYSPDKNNEISIHFLFRNPHIDIMKIYFDFLWYAYKHGSFKSFEVKGLFRYPNRSGDLPLTQAVRTGIIPVINFYFNQIEIAFNREEIFSKAEFKNMLIDQETQCNILHSICALGNNEVTKSFIKFLCNILHDETPAFLNTLLHQRNKNGIVPDQIRKNIGEVAHLLWTVANPIISSHRQYDERRHCDDNNDFKEQSRTSAKHGRDAGDEGRYEKRRRADDEDSRPRQGDRGSYYRQSERIADEPQRFFHRYRGHQHGRDMDNSSSSRYRRRG